MFTGSVKGADDACPDSGLCSQERNPELREPESFIIGSKCQKERDVIFITPGSKQAYLLLQGDLPALSSQTSLKRWSTTTSSQCLSQKTCRETRTPWRTASQHISTLSSLMTERTPGQKPICLIRMHHGSPAENQQRSNMKQIPVEISQGPQPALGAGGQKQTPCEVLCLDMDPQGWVRTRRC